MHVQHSVTRFCILLGGTRQTEVKCIAYGDLHNQSRQGGRVPNLHHKPQPCPF